jgi:transcriptional regulator with XRE-family HTH domain
MVAIMITQAEIAKKAGIANSTLSSILTGKEAPLWDTACRLAKATDTDPTIWLRQDQEAMRIAILKIKLKGERKNVKKRKSRRNLPG